MGETGWKLKLITVLPTIYPQLLTNFTKWAARSGLFSHQSRVANRSAPNLIRGWQYGDRRKKTEKLWNVQSGRTSAQSLSSVGSKPLSQLRRPSLVYRPGNRRMRQLRNRSLPLDHIGSNTKADVFQHEKRDSGKLENQAISSLLCRRLAG